jgi:hypothetical protein
MCARVEECAQKMDKQDTWKFNPLNAELNPICNLLALLPHSILHVSRIRVNDIWQLLHCLFDVQKMEHKQCGANNAYDTVANRYSDTVVKEGIEKKKFCRVHR